MGRLLCKGSSAVSHSYALTTKTEVAVQKFLVAQKLFEVSRPITNGLTLTVPKESWMSKQSACGINAKSTLLPVAFRGIQTYDNPKMVATGKDNRATTSVTSPLSQIMKHILLK